MNFSNCRLIGLVLTIASCSIFDNESDKTPKYDCSAYSLVVLKNQKEIDDFPKNYNCTEFTGELNIWGPDITNLLGLSQLTTIYGTLDIHTTTNLEDLSGLNNLTRVEGHKLVIRENEALTSLSGLGSLSFVSSLEISNNKNLASLSGLDNLVSIDGGEYVDLGLSVVGNNSLINLSGLSSLNWTDHLFVQSNNSLISLSGLNPSVSIIGTLSIVDNPVLSECNVPWMCNAILLRGEFWPQQNAQGCNSDAEVELSCNQ